MSSYVQIEIGIKNRLEIEAPILPEELVQTLETLILHMIEQTASYPLDRRECTKLFHLYQQMKWRDRRRDE